MSSQDAKSELLQQLKIDKSQPSNSGVSVLMVLVFCIFSALASGAGVFMLLGDDTSTEDVANSPSFDNQTTPASKAAAKNPITNSSASANPLVDLEGSAADSFAAAGIDKNAEEILNASGYITARRITTVSSETLGLLESIQVEEGMRVTENQVLAQLDDSIASVNFNLALARVEVLTARLDSIESDLGEAKRDQQRLQQLDESNFSSKAQLTRAQVEVEKLKSAKASALADIKVGRLEVDRQRELLQKHTIRAPFAGVVTKKNAQPGEIVSPSSAGGGFTRTGICTIVDMDSLEIEVDVNEAFIGRVYAEQGVVATLDAYPDWDIAAKVIAIIPTADRAKATVRVRIGIIDKDERILPDMGVKVAFLK